MLKGTPYEIDEGREAQLLAHVQRLDARVNLLRSEGKLKDETVARHYENTRLVDVTESNSIEGSTLSLHETELAVAKGTTLSGHDPAYVRDARALFEAFQRIRTLATSKAPTDIAQVKTIHEAILGAQPGAGMFRTEPVRISGAVHKPPPDWKQVMSHMEDWQKWSVASAARPALLRAAVLHAWLAHIHPFRDGNGRTARAVTTLELVRAGYPPLIIRRKDRPRYYEALAEADQADVGPFLELVLQRADDALTDLERTATAVQGYDPALAVLRRKQSSKLAVWNKAVELLMATISAEVGSLSEDGKIEGEVRSYDPEMDLDDYLALCAGASISNSWAFVVRIAAPSCKPVERLAWIGYRSKEMRQICGREEPQGPTVFWSARNPVGVFPKWRRAQLDETPGGEEFTYCSDGWITRRGWQSEQVGPEELARRIVSDMVRLLE